MKDSLFYLDNLLNKANRKKPLLRTKSLFLSILKQAHRPKSPLR